ncbi:hypothetical protein TIFTF001_030028 [Ficus carica]|uniref:Uncharacterized protein n=1 Tax=Ficus carica TaxID=3494 RepID=A0AA88DT18_FICCA|nr:hypothetical protein TIFTF001_030028 [Ficus carica]
MPFKPSDQLFSIPDRECSKPAASGAFPDGFSLPEVSGVGVARSVFVPCTSEV